MQWELRLSGSLTHVVCVADWIIMPQYFLGSCAAMQSKRRSREGFSREFDLSPIFSWLPSQRIQHLPANPASYASYFNTHDSTYTVSTKYGILKDVSSEMRNSFSLHK